MNRIYLHRIIWLGYGLMVAVVVFFALANFWGLGGCGEIEQCLERGERVKYFFSALMAGGHMLYFLGWRRSLIFIFLSAGTGFISEYLGLHYGWMVTSSYSYQPGLLDIGGVPLIILIFWSIFIYTGYSIANSFVIWRSRGINENEKEIPANHNVIMPAAGALIVLFIDLFMDPLQVARGMWQWPDGGLYFGVPISNFIGWFLVAFVALLIFQKINSIYPRPNLPKENKFLLMPTIGYGVLALDFLLTALAFNFYALAVIGTVLMGSVVICNMAYYIKKYV